MKIVKPSIEIISPVRGDIILVLLELYGRTCYKSEKRITPGSAEVFVRNLLRRGHESVIEHCSVTVRVICNRGISHEIVRHRIGAYSQESTRYVNYKDGIELIEQPALRDSPEALDIWVGIMERIEEAYGKLIELGVKPEIARDVLPNALKTEIVITYNLRQWRHFLIQRLSKAAHPQIRLIAQMILKDLKRGIPIIFDDIDPEGDTPNTSYRFFQNKKCEYYPCHLGVDNFNCLFCYCPLHQYTDCGGTYTILLGGCKDCSTCTIPHSPNGYDYIIDFLNKKAGGIKNE